MTHGTIQKMFLEAVAGTASQRFGEPTKRVAPRGGAETQELEEMHHRLGSGFGGDQVGESRARPRNFASSQGVRYVPAIANRRGYGRRRQSAGR